MGIVGGSQMMAVPYIDELVPVDREHRVVVVGPNDILTEGAPLPTEACIMDDGFHIRIALDTDDLDDLNEHPYLHLVLNAEQMPAFVLMTETDHKRNL